MLLQLRARGGRCLLRHLGVGNGTAAAAAAGQQGSLPVTAQQQHQQRRGLSSVLLSASASPAQQQARAAARARGVGLRGPQRRSMFIQTEATPNPESLKYLPGQVVLDEKYGTGMVCKREIGVRVRYGWSCL